MFQPFCRDYALDYYDHQQVRDDGAHSMSQDSRCKDAFISFCKSMRGGMNHYS